jgi:CheY-like chemotaxis protein
VRRSDSALCTKPSADWYGLRNPATLDACRADLAGSEQPWRPPVTSCDADIEPRDLTVLLAEDDPFLREAISSGLQACGFTVMEAESGDHAWPILETGGIDVLVTDISMPGTLDGWSLAERALAIHPGMAVVYISSGPESAARRIDRSLFLRKPFHPDAVVSAIRKVASQRDDDSLAEADRPGRTSISGSRIRD